MYHYFFSKYRIFFIDLALQNWGKRDEALILPINDSISATLHTDQLCAKTTVMASPDFKEDRIWLNGREESINNVRLQNCIVEIRKRAQLPDDTKQWNIHICSENNFPTAAGLASSAAGYACLVASLSKLYKVEGDVSVVARLGSGSACRSMMGGFVRWHMGTDPRGSDSLAEQITPASHWPEIRILILVVNDARKTTSSAEGMKRTLESSELLQYRAARIPRKVDEMTRAIMERNFAKFAELTMRDSNQFHAVCQDTYPPCHYMNDVSRIIVELIHAYNSAVGEIKVAYTYDAGPNASLFLLEKDVPEFVSVLDHFFPSTGIDPIEYRKGIPVQDVSPDKGVLSKIRLTRQEPRKLKYMIQTRIGDGPRNLNNPEEHLLDDRGLPVAYK